jgi:surface protein
MNNMFYGASSFESNLSNWPIENVVDMSSMFEGAASFYSDLYEWGNRLTLIGASPSTVKVENIFLDSGCHNDESPSNFEEGPWCADVSTAVLLDMFG